MILITSFLHREALREILMRWMCGICKEQDCRRAKQIINFNVYVIQIYLEEICRTIFGKLSDKPIWSFEVYSKGKLKDFILKAVPYWNKRLEEISENYRKFPEDFYRETPFHGKVYCSGSEDKPTYLGHSRVKRFRRIAEKTSRRIISYIFNQIKKKADDLATQRAQRLGIAKDKLITPIEKQIEEFTIAERKFIDEIKSGELVKNDNSIVDSINDVAGIKAIIEDHNIEFLEKLFTEEDRFKIFEKEVHSGNYNAINYIVSYRLDKQKLLKAEPDDRIISVLKMRGLDDTNLRKTYKEFINTSEDNVLFEVIAINYQEMVESELGRCMHEDRILAQRQQVEYKSSIARNVRYITEYLFLFALSGKKILRDLPIKLWIKTMPDTYDHAIRQLWDIPTMPVL